MPNKQNDNIMRSLAFDSVSLRRGVCYNLSVQSVVVDDYVEALRSRFYSLVGNFVCHF